MKSKWILVVAACLSLGLVSVPFWPSARGLGADGDATALAAQKSVTAPGGCDAAEKAAPAFTLPDMHGTNVSLSQFKGKVVILNFWATWCGPCKYEIPAFVKLQDKYRNQGVVFLGVSIDDPAEKLKPFAQKYSINYPLLVGLNRDEVAEAYGPMFGIPTTVLINRRGTICRTHTGMATESQLEAQIRTLL